MKEEVKIYNLFKLYYHDKKFIGTFSNKIELYKFILNDSSDKNISERVSEFYRIFESDINTNIDVHPFRLNQPVKNKYQYPPTLEDMEFEYNSMKRNSAIDKIISDEL